MARILAWIDPVDLSAHPEHPIAPGGEPPSIWPSPGYPAHPIAPGGPPPHPAHPIYNPPGIWGPPGPWPSPPIVIPEPPPAPGGTPEHPINLPPFPPPDGFHWELAFHPVLGGWSWVLIQGNPPEPPPPGYNPPSGGNVPAPVPAKK